MPRVSRRGRGRVVRVGLLVVAAAGLWLAGVASARFDDVAVRAQRFDLRLYLGSITPVVIAGACAIAAVRYPWRAAAFAWRWLWLVPFALVPAIHLALLRWAPQLGWSEPGWVYAYRWFDDAVTVAAGAAIAGAAIGCAFGAGRGDLG
jgi:hypothetical protein